MIRYEAPTATNNIYSQLNIIDYTFDINGGVETFNITDPTAYAAENITIIIGFLVKFNTSVATGLSAKFFSGYTGSNQITDQYTLMDFTLYYYFPFRAATGPGGPLSAGYEWKSAGSSNETNIQINSIAPDPGDTVFVRTYYFIDKV